jgi:hypothetical protein
MIIAKTIVKVSDYYEERIRKEKGTTVPSDGKVRIMWYERESPKASYKPRHDG